jgi:HAMP domain-containing protein
MKSVLNVNLLQQVADQSSTRIPGSSVSVVTSDGLLVAETSSNHDPKRIMNPDVNVSQIGEAQVFASEQASGYLLEDKLVTAFAHTAGPDFYKTIPGFEGFDWVVIVHLPKEKAYAPLASLEATVADLGATRQQLTLLIVFVLAITVAGALVLAFWLARSITRPISYLSEVAKKISMGDTSMHVAVASQDEIGELAATFNRMLSAMRLLLDEDKKE